MVIIRGKEVKKRTIISIVEVKVLKKASWKKFLSIPNAAFSRKKLNFL
jgi:hypothetical protein